MFAVNVHGVQNCYAEAAKQLIKQGNCTKENPGKLIAVRVDPAILSGIKADYMNDRPPV